VRPPAAAMALLGSLAPQPGASERLVLAGGYEGMNAMDFDSVWLIELLGVSSPPTPVAARDAPTADPWAALRGPYAPEVAWPPALRLHMEAMGNRPRSTTPGVRPPSFDKLMRAAAAAPFNPFAAWCVSWSCVHRGDGGDSDERFTLMVSVQSPNGLYGVCDIVGSVPSAPDAARILLRAATTAGGERPREVLLAARMGSMRDALRPLCDWLGIQSLRAESWAEAAKSAIAADTCPYGFNLPGTQRCVRCSARASSLQSRKLPLCAGCRTARYCSPECAKADWPAHRPLCTAMEQAKAEARRAAR